jgi:hypothetical protein
VTRRATTLIVLVVLAASGGYALVYLFRWEWHRAIIAALFFVAAEVGLGVGVVLRRLGRLEQRLDDLVRSPRGVAAAEIDPAVLSRIHEAAPPPSKPFAWLDPRSSNLSVFLPFLLGIGMLASGLAWVVEQAARHTTTPALERRLARQLAPLALPAGGLLGPAPVVAPVSSRPLPTRSVLVPLAAVVVVAALVTGGFDWLEDRLETRPDARRENVSTQIDVELRGARSSAWPAQAAATLWGTCSHVLHGTVGPASIVDNGGGQFSITVPTHIGRHAEDRVRGCLEDALVDRVQASVTAVETVPAG